MKPEKAEERDIRQSEQSEQSCQKLKPNPISAHAWCKFVIEKICLELNLIFLLLL